MVIDSLATYGSSLGTEGRVFRDFFHALIALMKEHQIAAIYNHENPEMFGISSMMGEFAMSSLVDNILLLNFVELGDTLAPSRVHVFTREELEGELHEAGLRSERYRVLMEADPVTSYAYAVARVP